MSPAITKNKRSQFSSSGNNSLRFVARWLRIQHYPTQAKCKRGKAFYDFGLFRSKTLGVAAEPQKLAFRAPAPKALHAREPRNVFRRFRAVPGGFGLSTQPRAHLGHVFTHTAHSCGGPGRTEEGAVFLHALHLRGKYSVRRLVLSAQ